MVRTYPKINQVSAMAMGSPASTSISHLPAEGKGSKGEEKRREEERVRRVVERAADDQNTHILLRDCLCCFISYFQLPSDRVCPKKFK